MGEQTFVSRARNSAQRCRCGARNRDVPAPDRPARLPDRHRQGHCLFWPPRCRLYDRRRPCDRWWFDGAVGLALAAKAARRRGPAFLAPGRARRPAALKMTQSLEPATNAVGRFQFVAANSALRNALLRITAIPNFRRSSPPSPPAAPIPNDHGRQISPLARRHTQSPPSALVRRSEWSKTDDQALRHWYADAVYPALTRCKLTAIMRATGLSKQFSITIRAGRRTPHPRHFAALAKLAGVPAPKAMSSVPSPTPRLSWGLARRLVRIRCGSRSRHHDRPRRDGHIRFAADRDCDRTVSRTGASPRRPNCCPADVGHRQRCRGRHMGGLVASRRSSVYCRPSRSGCASRAASSMRWRGHHIL